MAQLNVPIHGRNYPIVCDDGQEERVSRLAAYIDQRASEIAETVQPPTEIYAATLCNRCFRFLLRERHGSNGPPSLLNPTYAIRNPSSTSH